ncbi:hypothetical protein ABZV65_30235 [Streptomyces bauhiniae]|uniref:hypothetical protein n=1 Tax=Streptomyces bauhiniae TaxID=2340725 RepID=UPI0033BC3AAD
MNLLYALTTGAKVGLLLPLLTAVVQQPGWPARVKKWVAVAAAGVAGVVTVAAEGGWAQFHYAHLTVVTLAGVLAASQASYVLLWKPIKLAPWIEALTARNKPQQG